MAATTDAPPVIRPQPGPQEIYLSTAADIAIYGGAAGGGKTWALLMEPVRHQGNEDFGAVIFRRTYPQITNEGGLWDESQKLYPLLGATPNLSDLFWRFPSGARVKFAHLQHEKNIHDYQGAQIPLIGFDELTHFTERQFWYMLSRNRSTCGVRPYVRATTNPDADSWVAELIAWWIHPDTGYPIPERSGALRWFVRAGEALVWDSDPDALRARFPDLPPKSLTFIPARLEDNAALLAADPGYRANLLALSLVERERLLGGNWKIRPEAGAVFNRSWFGDPVPAAPADAQRVRYWDKAATEDDGDWTAGVLMARGKDGVYYVEHVVRGQWSAFERESVIAQTAQSDGRRVQIWMEQEPGSGGKESAALSIRRLAGYSVHADRVTGSKLDRAHPFSAQAEARNVRIVAGDWNRAFLDELHAFPDGKHDDQADAASGAFNKLALHGNLSTRITQW